MTILTHKLAGTRSARVHMYTWIKYVCARARVYCYDYVNVFGIRTQFQLYVCSCLSDHGRFRSGRMCLGLVRIVRLAEPFVSAKRGDEPPPDGSDLVAKVCCACANLARLLLQLLCEPPPERLAHRTLNLLDCPLDLVNRLLQRALALLKLVLARTHQLMDLSPGGHPKSLQLPECLLQRRILALGQLSHPKDVELQRLSCLLDQPLVGVGRGGKRG